ncbi:MAG TPA: EF-hand domain-containing protein [Bryobacteraceae bacterium]|nr:EF-hand domain-containing protein [Bryobacteraceae bacterium]
MSADNVDFKGTYKQALFQIADVNGDGFISKTELEDQVVRGGGTTADADALYGDINGTSQGVTNSGEVNGITQKRFSGALATPVDNNFGDQLLKVLGSSGAGSITKLKLEQLLMQNGKTEQQAETIATEFNLP